MGYGEGRRSGGGRQAALDYVILSDMANLEQLKKNIGQNLRLRPNPVLVRDRPTATGVEVSVLTSGAPIPKREKVPTDFMWRLKTVADKDVTLHCLHTDHTITLGADNVREYRTPDFLILKCQLILDGDKVLVEPLL